VKILSLIVPEKAHFFVRLQLQKDDLILDSNGRIRTEVSTGSKKTVHFKNNTFYFDASALTPQRNSVASTNPSHPPFLHRSASMLTSPSLPLDPLQGLDIVVAVYQVFPREDEEQGYTKLSAIGKASLMSIISQLDPSSHTETEAAPISNASDSLPGRLTRQGSALSSIGLDDEIIENELAYSVPLFHFYDKDDIEALSKNIPAQTSHLGTDDNEGIEFGQLNISLELRKRNIKDLRRPKRVGGEGVRESQTGILVGQNGLPRYYNPANVESEEFSLRCHGVYNLPRPMQTFLTLKTTEDVKRNDRARVGTSTTPPTFNYSWSDALVVNLQRFQGRDGQAPQVGLFLSLVDYLQKTHVAKCIIPVEAILPGEQYNFAIITNNEGTCIYVSLSLEPNPTFQSNLFAKHPELCCIEVLLHGVQRIRPPSPDLEDPFPSTSYLAVLHLESDFRKYLKSIGTEHPKLPCQTIRLDNASAFDQITPSAYRISPPSHPSLYPQWNCLFELTQSINDVFAPNAVLIVEIFEINAPRDGYGSIDFMSWTSIPLAELAQPGMRDGTIARHSSILHLNSGLVGAVEEPCEMHSGCAPHEFSLLLEMRRWSSRYYLRQKHRTPAPDYNSLTTAPIFNPSQGSSHTAIPTSPTPTAAPLPHGSEEESEASFSSGYLPHIRLHHPPPLPPPRLTFSDQNYGSRGSNGNPDLSPNGEPSGSVAASQTAPEASPGHELGPVQSPSAALLQSHSSLGMAMLDTSSSSDPHLEESDLDTSRSNEEIVEFPLDTISEVSEPLADDLSTPLRTIGSSSHGSAGRADGDWDEGADHHSNGRTTNSNKSSRNRISLPIDPPTVNSSRAKMHTSADSNPLRVSIPTAPFSMSAASAGTAPTSGPSLFSASVHSPVSAPGFATASNLHSATTPPLPSADGSFLSPARMPSKRSYHLNGPSGLKMSTQRIEKRLPEIDSVEAERSRQLLELRIAELDLETAADCPEKRVLSTIMPQVRHLVMRSSMTITKANIAEQKLQSLQAENLALKRQVQRLLASRAEEISVPTTSTRSNATDIKHAQTSTDIPPLEKLRFASASKSTPSLLSEARSSSEPIMPPSTASTESGKVATPTKSRKRAGTSASPNATSAADPSSFSLAKQTSNAGKPRYHARSSTSTSMGASSDFSVESGSADEGSVKDGDSDSFSGNSNESPRRSFSALKGGGQSAQSEYSQLMAEVSQMIESAEHAAKDHLKTAETVAAKIGDDFMTHFASGIERLKSEMSSLRGSSSAASSTAASPLSAPSAGFNALYAASSSAAAPGNQPSSPQETPCLVLRAELDKLKAELEQAQRKYLLTSAAFGEELLLLRSKLKERKHQLQEAKKMQTTHSAHHAHNIQHQHAHQRHYIALSPISVPTQPAWHSHAATPNPNGQSQMSSFSMATSSNPATSSGPAAGGVSSLPSPLLIPPPVFMVMDEANNGHTGQSAPGLHGSGSHTRTTIKSPRMVDSSHFTFTTPLQSPQLAHVPPPLEASAQNTGSGKLPRS
jgi:hypothetical protein